MHYLLIARFTMDDIPLRLYDSYDCAAAEAEAKAIHADPTLLDTKWKCSLDKWPGLPGGFVGVIVLSISDIDGYPSKVLFDSTAEPEQASSTSATPREPHESTKTLLPDGYVEITDPSHVLRPGVDRYLSSFMRDPDGSLSWLLSEKADEDTGPIKNWDGDPHVYRFCCPAEHHPSRQPAQAPPEPSGLSRATDNGTSLASAARSLDAENADLRRRVADLEAQVRSLISEKVSLSSKSEELQRNNVAYSRNNDELRALNEDLNHRLNATKARAERATDLEGKLRGTAQLLLTHFQRLEERAKWAFRFADEEMMPLPYAKAMLHCQRKFAEEFQGFLHMYPHVLPDIPEEYHPIDDTDDEMND